MIKFTIVKPEDVSEADLMAGKIVAVAPDGHVLSVMQLEQTMDSWIFSMPGNWQTVFKLGDCTLYKVEVTNEPLAQESSS